MTLYYDKYGEELDEYDWRELFEDVDYRTIGKRMVGDYLVSTVWLGIDHSSMGTEIIIFESMILDYDFQEVESYRYSTLYQAKAGHDICLWRAWKMSYGI